MRANGVGEGVGDGAFRIHGDARNGQAELLRRRSEAGKRQSFGQYAVAGTAEKGRTLKMADYFREKWPAGRSRAPAGEGSTISRPVPVPLARLPADGSS